MFYRPVVADNIPTIRTLKMAAALLVVAWWLFLPNNDPAHITANTVPFSSYWNLHCVCQRMCTVYKTYMHRHTPANTRLIQLIMYIDVCIYLVVRFHSLHILLLLHFTSSRFHILHETHQKCLLFKIIVIII